MCPNCGGVNIIKIGMNPYSGLIKYHCDTCSKSFFSSANTKKNNFKVESFKYGIPEEELRECPSCNENSCYWIGASPNDIECANKYCKFYKKYTKKNRYNYATDKPYEESAKEEKEKMDEIKKLLEKETDEIDPMDFSDLFK